MSEWGQRTLDLADSEPMDVAKKCPGSIGGGTLGFTWSEEGVEHQALFLDMRPLEEKG